MQIVGRAQGTTVQLQRGNSIKREDEPLSRSGTLEASAQPETIAEEGDLANPFADADPFRDDAHMSSETTTFGGANSGRTVSIAPNSDYRPSSASSDIGSLFTSNGDAGSGEAAASRALSYASQADSILDGVPFVASASNSPRHSRRSVGPPSPSSPLFPLPPPRAEQPAQAATTQRPASATDPRHQSTAPSVRSGFGSMSVLDDIVRLITGHTANARSLSHSACLVSTAHRTAASAV